MAVFNKVLIASKNAENAETTQYTAVGVTTTIDKFTATNYASTTQTISVSLVPSGGTAANSNLTVKTKSLQPSETYTFPELINHNLGPGDFISTIASAATSINIRASGREITF